MSEGAGTDWLMHSQRQLLNDRVATPATEECHTRTDFVNCLDNPHRHAGCRASCRGWDEWIGGQSGVSQSTFQHSLPLQGGDYAGKNQDILFLWFLRFFLVASRLQSSREQLKDVWKIILGLFICFIMDFWRLLILTHYLQVQPFIIKAVFITGAERWCHYDVIIRDIFPLRWHHNPNPNSTTSKSIDANQGTWKKKVNFGAFLY